MNTCMRDVTLRSIRSMLTYYLKEALSNITKNKPKHM